MGAAGGVGRVIGMPRPVIILSLSGFFVAIGFGVMIPVLPLFARTFGVSNLEIGLVVSAFAAVRLATSPFCGPIIARLGNSRAIGLGMFGVAVSSALCGTAGSYPELLLWRSIGGVGSAVFSIAAIGLLLSSVGRAQRGRASGLYQGSFLVGGMAGPAIGGAMAGLSLSAPFFFYAASLAVAGTIALTQLHDATDDDADEQLPTTRTLREVVGDIRFRAACLLGFGQGWQSFGVRSALVPVLIVESLHRDPSWTGIALAIAAVGQTAALYPVGKATDLLGRRPVMIAGGLVTATTSLAIPFATDIWVLIAVLTVYGIGAAALGTAPTAAVGDAARGAGGTPIAIFSMVTDIGVIIGPVAAGLLADRLSLTAAFVSGAVVLGLGTIYASYLPRRGGVPEAA